jgi:hypothetical protein
MKKMRSQGEPERIFLSQKLILQRFTHGRPFTDDNRSRITALLRASV